MALSVQRLLDAARLWAGGGGRLRFVAAGATAAVGVGAVVTFLLGWPAGLRGGVAFAAPTSQLGGPQASLLGAQPWLNTPPLRAQDLRGKVVLVNFWTYSCINSLRPLPYLRTWAAKYKDRGLVVVGVHTPEFGFEKNLANVRRAALVQGVGYPVVLDSDYGVWRAFDNNAWPAFYFIDAKGRVRHQKLGEGGYEESERLLQKLLAEARGAPVTDPITLIAGKGIQAAPDWRDLRSPESYVGYNQARDLASPGGVKEDAPSLYQAPRTLPVNRWSLAGRWTIGGEFATSNGPSAKLAYRFHARDLHLVLAPTAPGRPVRFRVRVDGAAPGAGHGVDVDAQGWGRVQDARLYQLVRQSGPVADRTFEIEFLDPGVRAYVFTFG